MKFKLVSSFKPTGDQPQAIEKLVAGIKKKKKNQVLLGVTGSGKTFTMANVIQKTQRPTLIISHNKTLASQLYQEFRDFFPDNAVSFFVSYYDYYQPEAYLPKTDTYIAKETEINQLIDKLRLRATTNLLTRPDTIIIASVSCIYNIGSPREYGHFVLDLKKGKNAPRQEIFKQLTKLQYERANYGFSRGTFRVRGETIDIFPAYEDLAIRVEFKGEKIKKLAKIDPLTGKVINDFSKQGGTVIYPAKHFMTDPATLTPAFAQIRRDLKKEIEKLKDRGKNLEAHRLAQRVKYDLEMIAEMGYVNGIENYSRYFDGRKQGDPPYTLLDYFQEPYGDDWLLFIDESHMSLPQIRGMYNGDVARKKTLVDFGFRLEAAYDNRPLKFDEFLRRMPQTIYTSATPSQFELSLAQNKPTEQLVRPTGLIDPKITLKPTQGQITDLAIEVEKRAKRGERTLVTTLTKQMAEELAAYLEKQGLKVQYLHSEIETLKRADILDNLRQGEFDCLVGINLLREGLDLPEVSLVAILDADKEGFLRSETSLIQTMGRASRHLKGEVIMYADQKTGSMERAVEEVERRRKVQLKYNKKHKITPETIKKPIREKLVEQEEASLETLISSKARKGKIHTQLDKIDFNQLTPQDRKKLAARLRKEMRLAAHDLQFELAAHIKDKIGQLE